MDIIKMKLMIDVSLDYFLKFGKCLSDVVTKNMHTCDFHAFFPKSNLAFFIIHFGKKMVQPLSLRILDRFRHRT